MSLPDEDPYRMTPSSLDATLDSGGDGPPPGVIVEGTEVGSFVVSRKLGAGAMGSVYAAWDARLEREVALKVLHLESDDLLREARLLARLNHQNVVTVHEVIPWCGRIVLVMEHARGRSLREWLAESPRSPAEILKVFAQCAAGLGAAHAAGVIHRDFKPDNALVDESARARLLDFGLATPQVTAGAELAGSPAYMALDQLEGARADERSDQFSWWLSLYEALAGRRPHDGATLNAMMESRRRETIDLAPLPLWLRRAMARGLSKNPLARFPSMDEAAKAIRRPWRRRVALMAALLLSAAAGLGVFASSAPAPCSMPAVSPAAFEGRNDVPALRDAAADYASALQRCLSLPREEQVQRAQCLDISGRELSLAFDALDQLPNLSVELKPRVLRRVLPAGRCERAPVPRVFAWNDLERPALLTSMRAQLEFDNLRASASPEEALRFAKEHRVAADASGVIGARAWARINEAAALSVTARIPEAITLLREVEAFPGIGLREETWAALAQWLFECYLGDEERCSTQREHARRFSTELDEPWTRALAKEIGVRYDAVSVEESVAAWGAIPGAGLEARRAMANELANVQTTDDPRRIDRARKLAGAIVNPDARTRLLILEVDALTAVRAGDLALARALLRKIEAEDLSNTPSGLQARHGTLLVLLGASRRFEEMLALTRPPYPDQGDPRFRYRMALMRVGIMHAMRSPELAAAIAQVEFITPLLNESERLWLEMIRERMALADGDLAAFQALEINEGEQSLREWQVAVLTGDTAKQKAVLARARAPAADDWAGRRLQIEALLEAGNYDEAASAAARLRKEVPSIELIGHARLQEARARWALNQRDEACRVMTVYLLWSAQLPSEIARTEQFYRECPVIGLSADPG